jgi:protein CpxP
MMNKIKILGTAVVVLMLLNIFLLVFFMKSKGPHHPRKGDPKEIVIERLHFDPAQVKVYEDVILDHRSSIEIKEIEMMEIRSGLYGLLGTSDRNEVDSLMNRIGAIRAEIEAVHFKHFSDIEAICREDQKAHFMELRKDLGRIFSKRR